MRFLGDFMVTPFSWGYFFKIECNSGVDRRHATCQVQFVGTVVKIPACCAVAEMCLKYLYSH